VKRPYGYLAVALVAVLVALAIAFFVWPGLRGGSQGASLSAGRAGRDQADVAAVVRLLSTLPAQAAVGNSGDLAPSLHVTSAALHILVPPGSVITPSPATWRRTGAVASITVTLRRPGQGGARYVAVLFRERGGWKLAQTFPWAPAVTGVAPGAPAGG
jgi:hypothetical protein